jgi:ubiquitin-like-conjugating enzyme ATG3
MNAVKSAFLTTREALSSVQSASAFLEKGTLTPDEFVAAGEALVFSAPSWQWARADAGSERAFLPADRQFLVTRGVPCLARAAEAARRFRGEREAVLVRVEGGTTDWVVEGGETGGGEDGEDDEGEGDLTGGGGGGGAAAAAAAAPQKAAAEEEDDDDGYGDLAAFVDARLVLPRDPAVVAVRASSASSTPGPSPAVPSAAAVRRARRYDLSITYDKFYACPRVYLRGWAEEGSSSSSSSSSSPGLLGSPPPPLLTPEQMLEDIMEEYAQRTVTIEAHPQAPSLGPHVSIHPCRTPAAMKRVIDALTGGGEGGEGGEGDGGGEPLRVESYLILFLKFMQAVVPTINYDFTAGARAKR